MQKLNVMLTPLILMNNKTISGMKCILYLFGLLALGTSELIAGELEGKNAVPDISNIGFMENPPTALKEKFPMCDAFLKVEWIDTDKGAGLSTIDYFYKGKKLPKQYAVLVHVGNDGAAILYIEDYKRQGILKKLISGIKRGGFDFDMNGLEVRAGRADGGIDVFNFADTEQDMGMRQQDLSLADKRMNICAPYPYDDQRMVFVEYRQLNAVYTVGEIENIKKDIGFPSLFSQNFAHSRLLDINLDGKIDYFEGAYLIYSSGSKYFELDIKRTWEGRNNILLTSTTTKKTCRLFQGSGGPYLTTDGKNYYLDNQCNLTELTGIKE